MTPLRHVRLLDPRDSPEASIRDSVRIPFAELSVRVHELPDKDFEVFVAGVEGATEAVDWLRSNGWRATSTGDFEFGGPDGCRLWSPSEFVEQETASIIPGSCLDLGCGSGRNAVFLASLGYCVVAVDRLADALARGSKMADQYLGAGATQVSWRKANLPGEFPAGEFDLIIGSFFFDLPTLKVASERLTVGGRLLVEAFTPVHKSSLGKPRSPTRVATPEALVELSHGLTLSHKGEAWHRGRHTARVLFIK